MEKTYGIVVNKLGKSFGKTTALKEVSLTVEKGELFGLIGPDGAGKTTLFRILTTLYLPDSGEAYVTGLHCVKAYKEIRKRVGYMPGRFSLYQDLTVQENLNFYASVFQTTVAENYHLIEDIYRQIAPFKNRRAGKLSGGMKQKLALCCALIHRPQVLFLDEPTTGVDALSRKEFWEMLKRLKESGITIIVSTPYMDEAILCDRTAFIQEGAILHIGKPQSIIDDFKGSVYSLQTNSVQQVVKLLTKHLGKQAVHRFGSDLHLYGSPALADFLTTFSKSHNNLEINFKRIDAGIEDCFIQLMQRDEQRSGN
ncbi:MAG: ATPase [Bacteroidetes bacterium]|nr:MAG: ATPase [Bacteroidota bacterium]